MANLINVDYMKKNYNAFSFNGNLSDFSCQQMHYHHYHEFIFIKNGVSVLIDQYSRQPLFGNKVAFVPSSISHRVEEVGRDIIEFQSVFIRKDSFCSDFDRICIFNLSTLGKELIKKLCKHNDVNITDGTLGNCLDLFKKIVLEDMNNKSHIIKIPESDNSFICEIIKFIQSNFMRKLTFEDFESELGYTARHINRIFNKNMNMSVFEYIRFYRILMTSIQLSSTDKQIINIAFENGYENLASMYNDFKKYYGLSPGKFRKIVNIDQFE